MTANLAGYSATKGNDMDPWKHRSSSMTCTTCMWYVEKSKEVGNHTPIVGRCRRHAPSMNGYPVVYTTDWCGDHKLDENKLPSLNGKGE